MNQKGSFQNKKDRFKPEKIVSKQKGSFQNKKDRFKTKRIVSKQKRSFQNKKDRFKPKRSFQNNKNRFKTKRIVFLENKCVWPKNGQTFVSLHMNKIMKLKRKITGCKNINHCFFL